MNWPNDHGTIDRALFIRSSRRMRVANVIRAICTERNFWRLVVAIVLFYGAYVLPAILRVPS